MTSPAEHNQYCDYRTKAYSLVNLGPKADPERGCPAKDMPSSPWYPHEPTSQPGNRWRCKSLTANLEASCESSHSDEFQSILKASPNRYLPKIMSVRKETVDLSDIPFDSPVN